MNRGMPAETASQPLPHINSYHKSADTRNNGCNVSRDVRDRLILRIN